MPCSVLIEMAEVHPSDPHWYLEILGTHPDWQRRGIASAVLAPVLGTCDADGLPAYLETQLESNVPFYRRHGFEVIGTKQLPDGGPNMWLMWREVRSVSSVHRQAMTPMSEWGKRTGSSGRISGTSALGPKSTTSRSRHGKPQREFRRVRQSVRRRLSGWPTRMQPSHELCVNEGHEPENSGLANGALMMVPP